jgi:hypothetical protein
MGETMKSTIMLAAKKAAKKKGVKKAASKKGAKKKVVRHGHYVPDRRPPGKKK